MDEPKKPQNKCVFRFVAIGVVVCIIAAILLAFSGVFSSPIQTGNSSTIINPKVIVYDEESSPFKIIASDDESVTVSSLDGIADDSIINAGVSDETPNGLLRKVVSTEQVDDGYRIATKPAALSEAIEKCDVRVTVAMMEDGTYAVTQTGGTEDSNPFIQQAFADDNDSEDEDENEDALDNLFSVAEDAFSASAGIMVEIDLKIESGEVSMRVVDHFQARLSLNSLNGSLEKELFNKPLKPFTFMVGPVFVVFTNEINIMLNAEASTSLLGFDGTAALDRKIGFEYSTAEGLKPVSEDKSKAPDLSFKPENELFGLSLGGALAGTLSSHLYGFAGPELSAALEAETDARLQKIPEGKESEGAITVPGIDWNLRGRFAAKVTLPISGTFIAKVPNFNPFDTSRDPVEFAKATLFDTEDAISLIDFNKEFGTIAETLPNTFTSQLYSKMGVEGPAFTFGYPDNWTIASSTVDVKGNGLAEEHVTLVNERGVEVNFSHRTPLSYGASASVSGEFIETVSDTSFEPELYPNAPTPIETYPEYGKRFEEVTDDAVVSLKPVVARMEVSYHLGDHPDYLPYRSLWVVPQEALSSPSGNNWEGNLVVEGFYYYGFVNFHSGSSLYYGQGPLKWPGNSVEPTEEEEKEIIQILSSFAQVPAESSVPVEPSSAADSIVGTWKCEIETGGASGFYLETWTINADGTAQFGTRQGRASYTWERTGQTSAEGAAEYRFSLIDGTVEGSPPSQELFLYYNEASDELSGGYIGDSFIRQ